MFGRSSGLSFKRWLQVLCDFAVLSTAYWLAFLFRFEFTVPKPALHILLVTWPGVCAIQYGSLALFGVPRVSWRYVTMGDTIRLGLAIGTAGAVLLALRLGLPHVTTAEVVIIPIGVLAMDGVLAFVGLTGERAAWRLRGEGVDRKKHVAT